MQATTGRNTGNAERVARAWLDNVSPRPLKDTNYLADLDSLRTAIESASFETVSDPQSECRQSMKLLAGLAASPGPMGDAAREELCDLYVNPPEQMSEPVRAQLLNTALEMCFECSGGHEQELAATVLVMAGNAPVEPEGQNGDGHRHSINQALGHKLGPEFEGADLLDKDRVVTATEQMAAGAQLDNLNWVEPASMATPEAARSSFDRMLSDVTIHQKTITVWVADAEGKCVPVVAQPMPSGGIHFHVISQDEAGDKVTRQLKDLSGDDCVILHKVDDAHIALKYLNANANDERGAGGVLREHTDGWSDKSAADQAAAKLVSQAERFEAVADERANNPRPTEQVQPLAQGPHSAPALKPRSIEANFNSQRLTKQAGLIHSALEGIPKALSLDRQQHEPNVSTERYVALNLASPLGVYHAASPEIDNFYYPARAFAREFNGNKAPLLFKLASPAHPLAPVSATLRDFRSGEHVVELTLNYQKKLLQRCVEASNDKDLSALKKALEEIVSAQADLLRNADKAIGDLEGLNSAEFSLETPELTAQARAEAKSLIEALKQYRECLTGESLEGGNAYADLVAFAKEATARGPSLEAAQALFNGVDSKSRTVPTPPNPPRQPPPDIVVKLPDATVPITHQVASPTMPQSTRAEFKTLASAAGFFRHGVTEQPTNVWFDISDTMNVHMKSLGIRGQNGDGAGFMERRRLSNDVNRRLGEMPESNKRLTTAVMKAGPVPLSLAKSPLWAHLDKARDAASGVENAIYREANDLKPSEKLDGRAQGLLSGKGQALVAISAQVLARLALLSTEITKRAALVTSKDPGDQNHRLFRESLLELQNWLEREVAKIDTAIKELDAVLEPNAEGVTSSMKADAKTLREGLVVLQKEFKDPAGLVQQAIGFTRASLASDEILQQAADALIV